MWMTLISPSIRRLLLLYATTQRTPGMLQLAMALVLPRNCYVCRECLKVSLSRVTYRLSFCDGVRTDPWDPQVWTTGIPDVLSIFPLPCIAVVVHQEKWGKMGELRDKNGRKEEKMITFLNVFFSWMVWQTLLSTSFHAVCNTSLLVIIIWQMECACHAISQPNDILKCEKMNKK